MKLQEVVEAAIGVATGAPARIAALHPAAGGSINDSRIATLTDGRRYFVKTHAGHRDLPGMFEAERLALQRLAAAGALRVPHAIAAGPGYLILEAFERGRCGPDWQARLGHGLARLHRATADARFGFDCDNYLGATPQPNAWSVSWADFWREQRLGWQLRLFERGGGHGDRLLALGYALLERLEELIGQPDEPPALLHGDLWSGNAAADAAGLPIVFDPASYYGRREAELGMMRLFGGFDERCEAAYAEVWPLEEGADRRIAVYRLYHELNHLNLFGASYYQTCLATLRAL